jgi:hypothetical protein
MERNQDVTLHVCGERPKTFSGGRDRLDTQNFVLLSIEFSVNRLAAVPAEAAVCLNLEALRRSGASAHAEFRLGENAGRANSLALASGLACCVAQTDQAIGERNYHASSLWEVVDASKPDIFFTI